MQSALPAAQAPKAVAAGPVKAGPQPFGLVRKRGLSQRQKFIQPRLSEARGRGC